jgi:hypothetical protein
MLVRARTLSIFSWWCLMGLVLSACPAYAEAAAVVREGGWRVVERNGKKMIEMSAIITNNSPRQAQYAVRFVVERKATPEDLLVFRTPAGKPDSEDWVAVSAVTVQSGVVAPGASAGVSAEAPYEALSPGAAHRFRAEIVAGATGERLPESILMPRTLPLLVVGGLTGLAAQGGSASHAAAVGLLGGSGVMAGRHEAHRVNGEWVENGSGTITLWVAQGPAVLSYAYTARGSSSATLAATATAEGQLTTGDGSSLPIHLTSATAQITFPGLRQEIGPVIHRSGATATGVFSAIVGGEACHGVLTLTNGTGTLDPVTGQGEHRFDIRFTPAAESRSALDTVLSSAVTLK